jgi:TonB family protein
MLESYLISVATKSTVLLAAGLLCLRFLRGRDAAIRHLICLVALASAAAMPLLALWSPQWSLLISVPALAAAAGSRDAFGAVPSNWPLVLAAIWALGALAMLGRAVGGWALLARVRRRSEHFQRGVRAEVRTGDVTTPLTCGVMRPLIVLPKSAREWDELRLRAVLLHESAHVCRRDCVAKYVAQGTRALLWWNPLAWMAAARLNREQEFACDEEVLAAGVPPDAYANVLLDVARECSSSLMLGCAMTGGAALRERFAHLFEWRLERARSTRRTAIAIPLLLVLITTVSFAEKIYKVGPGIVAPVVLKRQDPVYPGKEKSAKIQGKVELSLVVGTDQRAHNIKVTKSVTPALDASAVTAVQNWTFQPGTKNGKPVAVRAKIEINFKLL